MAIVSISNLMKKYDNVEALKGIDLEIEAGGIVGILGPNGAGKTTLVEIIEGLRQPTHGRLTVLGVDPQKSPGQLKERIGAQLQTTAISPELTPSETLALFGSFYQKSLPPSRILELVGLTEKANARNRTLSGGQKQRLAIGMALVNDPELLIFDEPTTGLDPMARRGVHDIVTDLRGRGKTILLTTHYIEEAEKLCDRVIMIKEGQIVADGTPFELVSRASGMSTVWIAVEGELDPTPLMNAGAEPSGHEGEYFKFQTHNPAEVIIALGEILKQQAVSLTDLRMKRPTLEDVYLELVGSQQDEEPPEPSTTQKTSRVPGV
ncbi:MAG: ABC transporter ATP-binding protein [candidate division KSB1 bacterium]|nr:ABC transporter ATP-binding protein [candidate division KSB1 bacterium]MDQ7065589.1 ABC transporter ATP-binding protein [candidate division KSB1 bacterium]